MSEQGSLLINFQNEILIYFLPRLIGDSGHHNHRHPATSIDHNVPTSVEPSSLITPIVPPLPPPLLNDNRTESTTGKISIVLTFLDDENNSMSQNLLNIFYYLTLEYTYVFNRLA